MPKIRRMHDSGELRTRRRGVAALVAGVLTLALSGVGATAGAAPAQQCGNTQASPALTVDRATLDSAATTTINVVGTNYLVPPHACGNQVFGGIYVFFGWVQPGGQWGPSHRSETTPQGLFGTSYSYPGEGGGAETRDDGTGTIRLVSFTAGGESGDSTPYHMDSNGNWATTLVVRGSTYSFTNIMTGAQASVDCLQVQCGVFTIGGHGKSSATNELFTPINFTVAGGAPVVPAQSAAAGAGGVVGGAAVGSAGGNATSGAAGASTGESGGTAAVGGADGVAAETTTTVAGEIGSIGEGGDGSSEEGEDDGGERVLDAENAASVQDFGSSGGGGGAVIVIVAVVVLLAVVGGGVLVLRRRSAGAGAGTNTAS